MTHFGFLSTYPPTRCGLATFTEALADALTVSPMDDSVIVRVLDAPDLTRARDAYRSPHLSAELIGGGSGAAAVAALSACEVAIVQHEYGIYGGEDGDEIIAVLAAVTTPTIVVLHTVLPAPTEHQRAVLTQVCAHASVTVVMTDAARETLIEHYTVDSSLVHVIPHGVASIAVGTVAPHARKRVLTWGLISPGKGIEWGIRATARLIAPDQSPDVEYVVAGQTHPKVLAQYGESYRAELTRLVEELGVESSVHLDGRYLERDELAALLAASDVVLLPYDSRDQATSGVLAEAVAAGIPVVATGFPHAVELLSGGAGIVVAHEDPEAIAAALHTILTGDTIARRMRDAALSDAADMSWPAVAEQYRLLAAGIGATAAA